MPSYIAVAGPMATNQSPEFVLYFLLPLWRVYFVVVIVQYRIEKRIALLHNKISLLHSSTLKV